jgi:phage-related protein
MGILAVSILAVNAAMLLNPAVLITAGIVALGVAVVAAYKKFEGFRTVVRLVVNGILGYVETMVNGFIKGINIIIKGLNLVPGVSIKEIGNISLPRMGGEPTAAPGIHDSGAGMTQAPDLSSNSRGMGGSTGSTVTVNVQGADPNAVVQALQRYVRTSGPVPVNTRPM